MPFVPCPNCFEAVIDQVLFGQFCENTLWFLDTSGADPTARVSECAIMADAWYTANLLPLQSNDVTYFNTRVTDQGSPVGPAFSLSGGGAVGGVSAPADPGNVTLAISFQTAGRGRGNRGRNFMVGLPGTFVSGNAVDVGHVTALVAAYAALTTAATSADFTWSVVSRFFGFTIVDGKKVPTPRVTGIPIAITSVIATDNQVDSQRRRLTGRGK